MGGGLALVLDAQEHHGVGAREGLLEVVHDADLRVGFGQRGRDERGRAGEGDFGAELGEAEDVRAGDAAEEDVAEDGDLEPLDLAEALADGEGVEQGLRRVLMGAVAGVNHRDVERVAEVAGGAGRGVAHHDGVHAHGADVQGGVAEGLALHQGRGRGVDGHDLGAELLGRDLEGRAGAGAGLQEEVHHRPATHQVEPLSGREGGQEAVGLTEKEFDLGSGEFLDAREVFFRPGFLFGHAG
ncbi:MAG: hypothetical protein RIR91_1181 [Verrucomicrobiota bacterium]